MRVLVIANTFPPGYTGGAEVANYSTCRGLIERGIDCSMLILYNRYPETIDDHYFLDRIPVHRVLVRTEKRRALLDVFDWRMYRATIDELERLKPDLVHIHNVSGATLAPYVACRRKGIPVVNTLHDLWLLCPNNMLYRRDGGQCDAYHRGGFDDCFRRYDFWGAVPYRLELFKQLTSNVSTFISPSQAVIDRHVEAGFERKRFRLVRLGFPVQRPPTPRHPGVREILQSRHHYRTLVFGGGGIVIKGAAVVAEAVPMMLRHVEKLRLVVAGVGDPELLDTFRKWEPSVRVLGLVPFKEMRSLFSASDLTIVASTWHENSPVTIFESFSAGAPVVGSAIGGIPEFIEPDRTGYLVQPGNAADLAEKVVGHFARPLVTRRTMRRRCVEKVRTELSLEQHLDDLQRVYAETLN